MTECENRKETAEKKNNNKKNTVKFRSQDTFCQKCDPLPFKWKLLRYQSEKQ